MNKKVLAPPRARTLPQRFLYGTLILFFSCLYSSEGHAQDRHGESSSGAAASTISANDLLSILQHCVELPQLQKYYPVGKDGKKQINISQHPTAFPTVKSLDGSDQTVRFIETKIPSSEIDGYYRFRSISEVDNVVSVVAHYFYNKTEKSSKILAITIEMKRDNDSWKVANVNLKGDTI